VQVFLVFFKPGITVNNFIFEKINPIYKTIENIPITKDELKKKLEGKDVIQEVNKMVINYTQNRAKKIKKLRKIDRENSCSSPPVQ